MTVFNAYNTAVVAAPPAKRPLIYRFADARPSLFPVLCILRPAIPSLNVNSTADFKASWDIKIKPLAQEFR